MLRYQELSTDLTVTVYGGIFQSKTSKNFQNVRYSFGGFFVQEDPNNIFLACSWILNEIRKNI